MAKPPGDLVVKPRKQEEGEEDHWGGSSKSVFLSKGSVRLWAPRAGMPCLSLRLRVGARPPVSSWQGSWHPSLLDPAKMAFSLVGQGKGNPAQNGPQTPQVPSFPGNIVPEEAGCRMSTYFLAGRFGQVSNKEGQS